MDLSQYLKALREGRIIHLTGGVDADMHTSLREQYAAVTKEHPDSELVVTLNTNGGSTSFGTAIYSDLVAIQTHQKVWLVCQGKVASWGTYLMMAIPTLRRVAMPMTAFYFHRGKYRWEMNVTNTSDTHEYIMKEYEAEQASMIEEQDMLIALLARRSGLTEERARELVFNPTYLTPEQAVKEQIISHILEGEIDE